MPASVRELFLVIRANDLASRQLRQVGTNLRALSRATDFQLAKDKLASQIGQKNLNIQQMRRRLEPGGIISKQQDLAMQKHLAALEKEAGLRTKIGEIQAGTNAEQMAFSQKYVQAAEKVAQAEGGLKGMTPQGAASRRRALARAASADFAAQNIPKYTTQLNAATRATAQADIAEQRLGESRGAAVAGIRSEEAALASLQQQEKDVAAAERMQQRASKFMSAGRALSQAGQHMQFLGGAAAVGLGFAANSAAKLQTSTALAATQAGSSLDTIQKKADQAFNTIIGQMQRFPATAQEMSQSIYDIFSGTNIQQIGKAKKELTIFNKAAVAGQSDLNTATQVGITIQNAFGLGVGQTGKLFQRVFAAVRFGRMNFDQFGASLNQLVPAFRSGNQSILQMLASMAFLTRRMPSTRMAATSLARGIEVLGDPKLGQKMAKMGARITDQKGRLLPLDHVLGEILKKFPQLAHGANLETWLKKMTGRQGTIQARRALEFLLTDFGQYRQMLKAVGGDQNELNRSFAALSQTAGVRWSVAINKAKSAWLELGQAALPAMTQLVNAVAGIATAFDNLGGSTKKVLGSMLVWGAVGVVVTGTLIRMAGAALSAVGTFNALAIAMEQSAAVATIVGAGLAAMTVVGFAVAIGAALYLATAIGDAIPPMQLLTGANQAAAQTAQQAAANFQQESGAIDQLTGNTEKFKNAQLDLRQAHLDVKLAERQLSQARKSGDKLAIEGAKIAVARAKQEVIGAQGASDRAKLEVQNSRRATNAVLHDLIRRSNAERNLRQRIAKEAAAKPKPGAPGATAAFMVDQKRQLAIMRDQLKGLVSARQQAVNHLAAQMPKFLQHFFPKLSPREVQQVTGQIEKMGKLPSDKGLKRIVHMVVKADTKDVNPKLQAAQRQAQKLTGRLHGMKVTANMAGFTGRVAKAITQAGKMRTAVTKKQNVNIDTSSASQALDALITKAQQVGTALANALAGATKKGLKTGSPSKVFMKIGEDIMAGLVQGISHKKADFKSQVSSVVQAMESAFDEMKQSNTDAMGELFSGPLFGPQAGQSGFQQKLDFGAKLSFQDINADMKIRLKQFRQWRSLLNALASKGFPPTLIQQLEALGPGAVPELQALNRATPRQRRQYVAEFRKSQRLLDRATRTDFGRQQRIWQGMGRNVAFGILAGLRQEGPAIVKYIAKIAKEMFKAFQHHNKSHSPSKLYYEEGRNMMMGLQLGMQSVAPMVPIGAMSGSYRGGGGDYHYHQHFTASPNESEQAMLTRARWAYERQIRKRR